MTSCKTTDAKSTVRPSKATMPSQRQTHKSENTAVQETANLFSYGLDATADDVGLTSMALNNPNSLRPRLHRLIKSELAENTIAVLVVINIVVIVIETDVRARDEEPTWWMVGMNMSLLFIFSLEIAARLFVYRSLFFFSALNWVDFITVGADLFVDLLARVLGASLPSLAMLRLLRLLRLCRSIRVIMVLPQLALMVKGLLAAFSAILWGVILLFFTLLMSSVVAVQVLHPLNLEVSKTGVHDGCERCPRAFATVFDSALTFTQQIIAGDSWGLVSIPIIEVYPASMLLFILVFVTLHTALLNVILAVIVDSAMKFSAEDAQVIAEEREKHYQDSQKALLAMCQEVDTDNSGCMSLPELLTGLDTNPAFKAELRSMDIKEEDMSVVFKILDADGSGDVDYHEFVEELYKMKSHDSHTMLVFIKYYCVDIRNQLVAQLNLLEKDVMEGLGQTIAAQFRKHDSECKATSNINHNHELKESQRDLEALLANALGGQSHAAMLDEVRRLRQVVSGDLIPNLRVMSQQGGGGPGMLRMGSMGSRASPLVPGLGQAAPLPEDTGCGGCLIRKGADKIAVNGDADRAMVHTAP